MPIMVTEKAAKEVQKIIADQNHPEGTMLRVGVSGGGCSGLSYSLKWDANVNDGKDDIYDFHGVKIVVDKMSDLYLTGTTIDFYEGIDRRGFTFNNPKATRTCGCGSSFST